MNIRTMLPGLDVDALKTVRINANRLSTFGTPKQKEEARHALVLIDEEEARRRAELPPAPPKTRKKAVADGGEPLLGKARTANAGS